MSTSLWEGLPLAVLKAMALGKALLLYNCVGNMDCVKDNGKIFHDIDETEITINNVINEPEVLEKWGKVSRERYQDEFTLNRMSEEYLMQYQIDTEKYVS